MRRESYNRLHRKSELWENDTFNAYTGANLKVANLAWCYG